MWTILFILVVQTHNAPAATSQQIGTYSSRSTCEALAKNLTRQSSGVTNGRWTSAIATAQCIQIKDKAPATQGEQHDK